jgi:hypothetical protein
VSDASNSALGCARRSSTRGSATRRRSPANARASRINQDKPNREPRPSCRSTPSALRHFYVKQVESRNVNEFSHMSNEELEAYIAQQNALLAEMKEPKPTIAVRSNGRTKH